MCEVLATAGIRVVAVARRRERLEALQQELISKGVPIQDFLPVVCDITKVSPSSRVAVTLQGTQQLWWSCTPADAAVHAESCSNFCKGPHEPGLLSACRKLPRSV